MPFDRSRYDREYAQRGYVKERRRQYRRQHRRRINDQIIALARGVRRYIQAQKAKPCTDCGVQYAAPVMEFDHLPGSEKWMNLSRVRASSLQVVRAEIAKCEIVCANCHRLRTMRRSAERTPTAKKATAPNSPQLGLFAREGEKT